MDGRHFVIFSDFWIWMGFDFILSFFLGMDVLLIVVEIGIGGFIWMS
jgi:hypothetical protein